MSRPAGRPFASQDQDNPGMDGYGHAQNVTSSRALQGCPWRRIGSTRVSAGTPPELPTWRRCLPERVRLLQSFLGGSKRELIVCYGKAHWSHYESLFPEALWRNDGRFRVAQEDKTRIILAPHFTAHGCNTLEHLGRLAEVALSPSVKI